MPCTRATQCPLRQLRAPCGHFGMTGCEVLKAPPLTAHWPTCAADGTLLHRFWAVRQHRGLAVSRASQVFAPLCVSLVPDRSQKHLPP